MELHTNNIEILSWDTDFLGFPVAKIIINDPSADLEEINRQISDCNASLIYCFVDENIYSSEVLESRIKNVSRVDGRTRYVKKVTPTSIDFNLSSGITTANCMSTQLYKLALKAGRYSRFITDKRFKEGVCDALYKIWIEKSVSGEIADEVFVYQDDAKKQLGFLTVAEKNNQLDLGLLCIDEKARGMGIATHLLRHAENYATQKKYPTMQLVTQEKNIPACRLFEKYGFVKASVTGIYHIWK